MALLEHFSGVANAKWGRGWEQFRFWYTDPSAKKWHEENFPPEKITAKFLWKTGAPLKAIALIRDIAYMGQLEGLKIDDNGNYTQRLAEMGLGKVGEAYINKTDNSRTTNFIIPIKSNSGQGAVEIVVNSAWGVQWRLSKDHPLSQEESKLMYSQNPDESVAPTEKRKWGMTSFVDPHELEIISKKHGLNALDLSIDIYEFVQGLLEYPGVRISSGGWSLGKDIHDGHAHSMDIDIEGRLGMSFHIGNLLGSKKITIFNLFSENKEAKYIELSEKAKALQSKINAFYDFTYQ